MSLSKSLLLCSALIACAASVANAGCDGFVKAGATNTFNDIGDSFCFNTSSIPESKNCECESLCTQIPGARGNVQLRHTAAQCEGQASKHVRPNVRGTAPLHRMPYAAHARCGWEEQWR